MCIFPQSEHPNGSQSFLAIAGYIYTLCNQNLLHSARELTHKLLNWMNNWIQRLDGGRSLQEELDDHCGANTRVWFCWRGSLSWGHELESPGNKGVIRGGSQWERGMTRLLAEDRAGTRASPALCVVYDANHPPCFLLKSSVKSPFWLLCSRAGGSPKTWGSSVSTSYPQRVC